VKTLLLAALAVCLSLTRAHGDDSFIILQSTTSTQNSGLYDAILPDFTDATGIEVRVVAVGTGQAIKNAGNCDGDVLLVHARDAEEAFVASGFGRARFDVMYNDFVLIGPRSDPVDLTGIETAPEALRAIAAARLPFASRGDESGTHKKEMSLWAAAGLDPVDQSGTWYRETGSGMGATLNIATGMNAYTLSDRATWLAFENKQSQDILFEGDPTLFNQYGVVVVNPAHCPRVKAELGQRFVDWLLGQDGQNSIAGFQRDGTQLFFPNAR